MRGLIPRRLAIAGVALAVLVVPPEPAAQPDTRVRWIGYLANEPTPDSAPALREALHGHGWVEGQSVKIWYRYAQGKLALYPNHVDELVRLNVAVIVAVGAPAIEAARQATKTIPIVMISLDDPVAAGLAGAAGHGRNLTGLTTFAVELSARRLDLLRQAVPGLTRVAALWNPASPSAAVDLRETQVAARALGVELAPVEVRADSDLREVFAAVQTRRAQGLIVLADALTLAHRQRIATLASRNRLPTVCPLRDFADAGGLLSYGAIWTDVFHRAAVFVDRILRGAKPSDLPVERAARFELVINLKTARALDLAIPSSLLLRADRVIQ